MKEKRVGGFTLIEVIIAMVVFSFVLMSANAFLIAFSRANGSMKRLTQATQLGNSLIENVRNQPYTFLSKDAPRIKTDTINNLPFKSKCEIVRDSITWKEVQITITWPYQRRNHEVVLSTIIAQ